MIPGSNYATSKNTLNIDQRPHEFKGNLHYQPLTNPGSRYTNPMTHTYSFETFSYEQENNNDVDIQIKSHKYHN